MLPKEMALLRDHNSHLQFKLDNLKYNQQWLKQNIRFTFKVKVKCVVMVLLLVAYVVFNSIN